MTPSLTSYSCPNARLLNFVAISHCWALVKRIASGFIRFPLQFIELEGLESNMSKVRTYQLSAHQQLQFKVCTQVGDYCIGKQDAIQHQ